MADLAKKKWWQIRWFSEDDTAEDRKFIMKLDLIIVPYLVVSYWVKNLDQNNLNNAYVSGMKEDLGFYGNQLIQLQTIYIVGAVLGQLPFLFVFTYVPMHYLLPGLDVFWGIFTLLQYRAAGYSEMMAYRFMIGWFEAAYFPAVHYVLGSWYRRYEISRRGGIWYIGLPIGTLTAGLVQAAATQRLDGVHGLAGWRWMYIICAIITIPVGIAGFFLIPGTIDQPNRMLLSQHDVDVARRRLQHHGHAVQGKLKLHHIRQIFTTKSFYLVVLVDVLFWNHSANTGGFLLWLKSLKKYSSEEVNQLGTLPSALGIFYTLFTNFSSDLLWGPRWGITFAATANSIAMLILTIWNVPIGAKWWAFCSTSWSYSLSSSLYGWVNNILRDSPETRSFTLVFINIIAQSTTAWKKLQFIDVIGEEHSGTEAIAHSDDEAFPVVTKQAVITEQALPNLGAALRTEMV
ncbi:major facilitator superfamily transporter [Grosmannia clavigera kw1407]|uniref:Major facilitator superfamily transporter n=1 Tax=Grosmannia clavigera (strain kw1407 / UAMH 11150) TaxID=655863 RepID=F0X8S6_GROCL|nr:major facilitator superfamily transporter [Grosmannia clavigera kw1407]EFX06126.1 major facilitator superfamily transporter [Grosmannia clavigera kw1407]